MNDLQGLDLKDKIYESRQSVVYRGFDGSLPIVLKVLNLDYPTNLQVARFHREFRITQRLNSPTIIRALKRGTWRGRPAMVLEDFGGESLNHFKDELKGNLGLLLGIAVRLAEALALVHRHDIIHKDINPSNIVWNPDTDQLAIIDFGLADVLDRQSQKILAPGVLEGTLRYLSPEQTGRMNRRIDYHTDLYSFGITLFELLTGEPPFTQTDPMELIHAHMAQIPPPAHDLNPKVPSMVSRIVAKLLEKAAEDRYQNGQGPAYDLRLCLKAMQRGPEVAEFLLGSHDFSTRFQIPQKLYGREDQLNQLLAGFSRVASGIPVLALVRGYSGIGKSALIQEIHKPLAHKRGYFVSGKCDPLNRNTPYGPFIRALTELTRCILTESETRIAFWRNRLTDALGPNGGVITQIIPDAAHIMGPQPAPPKLSPVEAENRFHMVFRRFVETFAGENRLLALFIDDLQWADSSSLALIEVLMTRAGSGYLFLIGSYRDNEVDDAHPLAKVIASVTHGGARVETLELKPLSLSDIDQLLADTLNRKPDQCRELARVIRQKTMGNPFFVCRLLQTLYEDHLLEPDPIAGGWTYDINAIRNADITDNVVQLMENRISKLTPRGRRIMELAACIGVRFDLETLAIVNDSSQMDTGRDLWEPLKAGLIVPLDDHYKWIDDCEDVNAEFKFLHDRVHQAAYEHNAPDVLAEIHLRIGRLLHQRIPVSHRLERLFDVVNQFNLGRKLIQTDAERLLLAQMNREAGRKACESAAFGSFFNYMQVSVSLLKPQDWEDHPKTALDIHTDGALAALLETDYSTMDRLVQEVLHHTRDPSEQLPVYETLIKSLIARNRTVEAVEKAMAVLELFGIHIPNDPGLHHGVLALAQARFMLRNHTPERLLDLDDHPAPSINALLRFMISINSALYLTKPEIYPPLIKAQLQLLLKHGNGPLAPATYVAYGLVTCGVFNDIETGSRFGKLALELLDRFQTVELKCKVNYAYCDFIHHWRHPLRDSSARLLSAYRAGVEIGDAEFAGYSLYGHLQHGFLAGMSLEFIDREMTAHWDTMVGLKHAIAQNHIAVYGQAVTNLLGRNDNPTSLTGARYDEENISRNKVNQEDRAGMFIFSFVKMMLCYLFEKYDDAVPHMKSAESHLIGIMATPHIPEFYYYQSLILLARVQRQGPFRVPHRVIRNLRRLQKWAKMGPENLLHKVYLVQAEAARVRGHEHTAAKMYDRAVERAAANGFSNQEALALELAARFHMRAGRHYQARNYLRDARYAWQKWGCAAKVHHLELLWPELLAASSTGMEGATVLSASDLSSLTSLSSNSGALDLSSVMKASQAISGEIVLDNLLDKMLLILLENAGARKGTLFLFDEETEELTVEVQGGIEQRTVGRAPLDRADVPVSVVSYTARTRGEMVLHDAASDPRFEKDPYMLLNQPKSLLCLPILNRDKLTGVLYLENDLAEGVFTSGRIKLLQMLSSQIAISLENARLYTRLREVNASLENQVRVRTAELKSKNEELETLDQIIEAVNREVDLESVLGTLLEEGMGLLPSSERAFAWMRTADEGPFSAVVVREADPELGVVLNDAMASRLFGSGRREIYIVPQDENRALTRRQAGLAPAASVLVIALDPGGRGNAFLVFENETTADAFNKEDLRRLIRFRAHAQSAIAKAALLKEVHEKSDEILRTRDTLLQREKMASLGALTAGVAHEIRNPLNFVNNFADATSELVDEIMDLLKPYRNAASEQHGRELTDLMGDLSENARVIKKHGSRADNIVQEMLRFARVGRLEKAPTDLNRLVDEYVGLAYKGMRTNNPDYRIHLERDYAVDLPPVMMAAQNVGRVCLNMVENAGYALLERTRSSEDGFVPVIRIETLQLDQAVQIRIRDNGTGIDDVHLDKIFNPFFTSKPTGTGNTGLGLSISYDIIVKEHGGELKVDTRAGEFTEFIITLPIGE